MGSQVREDVWKGGGWWTRQSHICMQINQEEQMRSETDHTTQGSSMGNKDLKHLVVKICWGCCDRRNFQSHRRVCWRDPQGPRT